MKRIISLLLCLSLLLSIVPAAVAAEEKFTYEIKNGKATLTGVLEDAEVLYLPETLGGCPVTRIANGAVNRLTAKKIIVPETVKQLDYAAIYYCEAATVYITGKNTAFTGDSIVHAYAVCGYSNEAYEDLFFLTHYLPMEEMPREPWTMEEVTEGNLTYAVRDGEAIVLSATEGAVKVPQTLGGCPVTRIAPCAFLSEHITSLSLPEGIRIIGRKAVDNPYMRSSVTLPSTLEYVGDRAFYQVQTFGDLPSIKHIGEDAFYLNRRKQIVLGENLEYVGDYAFSGNDISEVTIPASTRYLGKLSFGSVSGGEVQPFTMTVLSKDMVCDGAFEYVTKVIGYKNSTAMAEALRLGLPFEDIETGELIGGVYTVQKDSLKYCVYYDRAEITGTYDLETEYDVYTVPESIDGKPVTAIRSNGIQLNARRIILPDTVTEIYEEAINYSTVQELVMPKNLKKIYGWAFISCVHLRLIFWPDSITDVEIVADWAGSTELFSFCEPAFFIGKADSVVEKLAKDNNTKFYPVTPGVEYITDGVCICSAKGGEATLLGMYYKGTTSDPSTYIIPDTLCGVPVTVVSGNVRWGYGMGILYLGANVVKVEDGAFQKCGFTILVTTPAVQYLPYPLFREFTEGTIYGFSDTYAERFAKEHGYPFYPLDTVPFDDVSKNDWYYEAVYYCYMTELMNGTSLYTFDPNGTTTRAMLAKVLHNMSGAPAFHWEYGFKDVSVVDWYCEAVNWCRYYSLAYGTSDYYFSPNQNVTREQVATFLYRYAEACGFPTDGEISLSSYSDARRVSSYAKPAISWAVSNGIINGNTPTTLNPQGYATRAEIATMLMRFVQFAEQHMEAA